MVVIEILYQRKIGSPLVERVLVLLSTVYSVALRAGELRDDPPPEFVEPRRGQYNSEYLLSYYSSTMRPPRGGRLAILLDEDAYVPGLNFVFGEALPGWGGIVYVPRLRPEFYGKPPDDSLLALRIAKEVVHEIGHSLGLGHCPNYNCVMWFSNSIVDTDRKGLMYCRECIAKLESLGLGHFVKRLGEEAR